MPDFTLHPTLEFDTLKLGQLPLCQVLMMNESQFHWVILVPRRDNIRELHDLKKDDQIELIQETNLISELLLTHFGADKINIGALGNLVPQFHMHVVARSQSDVAWPDPIWGNFSSKPYSKSRSIQSVDELVSLFTDKLDSFTTC